MIKTNMVVVISLLITLFRVNKRDIRITFTILETSQNKFIDWFLYDECLSGITCLSGRTLRHYLYLLGVNNFEHVRPLGNINEFESNFRQTNGRRSQCSPTLSYSLHCVKNVRLRSYSPYYPTLASLRI